MASRWFIINEWLLNDLLGDNEAEAQKQSVQFLSSLIHAPHGIVILQDSPWMRKAWQLMRRTETNQRLISKLIHEKILRDLRKCKLLKKEVVDQLPDNLQQLLNNNLIDADDEYLLQTWCSSPEKVEYIVTTDTKLQQSLAEHYPEIRTLHRDQFLADYPRTPSTD